MTEPQITNEILAQENKNPIKDLVLKLKSSTTKFKNDSYLERREEIETIQNRRIRNLVKKQKKLGELKLEEASSEES